MQSKAGFFFVAHVRIFHSKEETFNHLPWMMLIQLASPRFGKSFKMGGDSKGIWSLELEGKVRFRNHSNRAAGFLVFWVNPGHLFFPQNLDPGVFVNYRFPTFPHKSWILSEGKNTKFMPADSDATEEHLIFP